MYSKQKTNSLENFTQEKSVVAMKGDKDSLVATLNKTYYIKKLESLATKGLIEKHKQ